MDPVPGANRSGRLRLGLVAGGMVDAPGGSFLRDRQTSDWYCGRPVRPADLVVGDSVEGYVPAAVDPKVWNTIGPAARAWVLRVPVGVGRQAVQRLKPLAQYLAWRHALGMDTSDPARVFRVDDIEQFIAQGCDHLATGTQATYRSALRTIGEHVAGADVACPDRTRPIGRSTPEEPYSPGEFAALCGALSGLSTGYRRHNARVLLTYGRGAGLAAGDIARLVGSDHQIDANGTVTIHLPGPRARSVTLLRQWERDAAQIADLVGHRPVFRSSRERIGHREVGRFTDRLRFHDAPNLSVIRLRVSWIVDHLTRGTPLPVLAAAAGISATQLARYAEFLPAHPIEAQAKMLRDGGPL